MLNEEPLSSPVRIVSQRHASTISTGPMSVGIIQLSNGNLLSSSSMRRNESTEHICMFSVCLMFIGVPIIVVGIIFLSFFSIFGVTLMVVGIVASSSGAMLAIISAIMAIFAKTDPAVNTSSAGTEYLSGMPSGRSSHPNVYDSVHTIEVPQTRFSTIAALPQADNISKISDSQLWENYSTAQNPKAYLDSFGDLPKVIPSPQPSIGRATLDMGSSSSSSVKRKKQYHKKVPSLKAKLGKAMGSGKSLSRQELTKHDGIEVMHSSSSSSTSSPVRESNSASVATTAAVESNYPVVVDQSNVNGNIVTIESCEVNIAYDNEDNDDSDLAVISATNDIIDDMKRHSNNYSSDEFEKIEQQYAANNQIRFNGDNGNSDGKAWPPLEETRI